MLQTGYSLAADGSLGTNLLVSLCRVVLGRAVGVTPATVLALVSGLLCLG
jgi:sulfonate transport system permease protein